MELTGNRAKSKKLLKGGVALSIVFHVLYVVATVIYTIILLIVGLFAAVIAAIIGAAAGSGGDVTSPDIAPGYIVAMFVLLGLAVLSIVGIVFSIISLNLIQKGETKKALKVAGIFAIISGVFSILIPLELIGGIIALKAKVDEIEEEKENDADVKPEVFEEKQPEIIDAEISKPE